MSNIEPTEEQKQAARAWQDGVERRESGHPTLALFLAEREAKLRKQLAFMEAGSLADYNAFAEALQKEDAYLAEINLINERLAEMREVDGRKSRMLYDRDVIIDTLRARVAELENSLAACRGTLFADDRYNEARTREAVMPSFDCGGENCGRISCSDCTDDDLHARYWQELGKGPGGDAAAERRARAWWTTEGKRLKAASEREAQHLADIKAAREFTSHMQYCICKGIEVHYSDFDATLQRLAHYDDAKVAAPECPKCQEGTHPFYDVEQARWLCDRCHHPAGEPFVHVDDDHKNGPCGWSGCGRCGDAEGGEG